jgi:hypothetical protein
MTWMNWERTKEGEPGHILKLIKCEQENQDPALLVV